MKTIKLLIALLLLVELSSCSWAQKFSNCPQQCGSLNIGRKFKS